MSESGSAWLLLSSCASGDDADRLARALVEARLAACVQVLPGLRSTYRWAGQIEQADEVLLLIKTSGDRRDAAMALLRQLHRYELPEILAVEAATGSIDYLGWLWAETRPHAAS